jgi:uncharacterized protein (TIGR02145 family)
MQVKKVPTTVGYLKGDKLNLSGLKIRVIINNQLDSILDLPYAKLKSNGIVCSPDSGDILNTAGQITITIKHTLSGKSTTQSITVYNTVTDAENNVYKIVTIGNQVWMAENLRSTKYNDNTSISLITDSVTWASATSAAYCWYRNNESSAKQNKYGALYNYYAVSSGKLCPSGWHVATDLDWQTLFNFVSNDGHSDNEAKALKALSVWDFVDVYGTDNYGFTAVPCGRRNNYDGAYWGAGSGISGQYGFYWTSTGKEVSFANYSNRAPSIVSVDKKFGGAVRCVKD